MVDELKSDPKPLVSIICNAYNHGAFIEKTIDGFLMQKCNFAYEILVHDDASTDNTAKIIYSYEAQFPDIIKPIYQKINQRTLGVKPFYLNHNRALGKYIAICEGDDFWTDSEKLEKQVRFLEHNSDVIMCAHEVMIVDEYDNVVSERRYGIHEDKLFIPQDIVMGGAHFPMLSLMYRNIPVDDYPKKLSNIYNGDIYMISFRANYGQAFVSSEVMGAYRIHSGGVWSALDKKNRAIKKMYTLSQIPHVLNNNLKGLAYFRLLANAVVAQLNFRLRCKYIALGCWGMIRHFRPSMPYYLVRRFFKELRSKNVSIGIQKYKTKHFDRNT